MFIKLDAHLKSFEGAGYLAWIDHSKMKMSVQGNTPEEATKALLTSLKVKLSYMFGIDIDCILEQEFTNEKDYQDSISNELKETGKRELKFQLA